MPIAPKASEARAERDLRRATFYCNGTIGSPTATTTRRSNWVARLSWKGLLPRHRCACRGITIRSVSCRRLSATSSVKMLHALFRLVHGFSFWLRLRARDCRKTTKPGSLPGSGPGFGPRWYVRDRCRRRSRWRCRLSRSGQSSHGGRCPRRTRRPRGFPCSPPTPPPTSSGGHDAGWRVAGAW